MGTRQCMFRGVCQWEQDRVCLEVCQWEQDRVCLEVCQWEQDCLEVCVSGNKT